MAVREIVVDGAEMYHIIDVITGRKLTKPMGYEDMDKLVAWLRNGGDNGLRSLVFDW